MDGNLNFSLLQRLTRIFSGPLARKRFNNSLKLKRRYYNKFNYQQVPWNFSVFGNIHKTEQRWLERAYQDSLNDQERIMRYREFELMETMPEIARALEIYADECTVSTKLTDVLDIESNNIYLKEVLWRLFYDTLDIKGNLWGWVKNCLKYGDYFLLLYLDEEFGITHTMGLPEKEIRRVEGLDKNNPDYVKFRWETEGIDFENFQVVHFRLGMNDKYAPYGVSILEACRRIYRQLSMQEDVMMAYRIARSPERRVFYIDQEGIPPELQEAYFEKIKSNLRSNQIVNNDTGEVYKRYNAWSIEDDIFIPKRGPNDTTRIESLPGGQYVGVIDDIKYLRAKLFTALGIPSSYLEDKEGSEDKESLAQKDVRFASTISRIQTYIISALEKIAQIHLTILGFRSEDLVNFKLKLNNPSKIWELQELEFWRTKIDLASAAEGKLSNEFIYKKFFGFSDEEIRDNHTQMYGNVKFSTSLEFVKSQYMQELASQFASPASAGLGGGGGELGGVGGGLGGPMGGLGGGGLGDLLGGAGGGGAGLGAPAATTSAPEAGTVPEPGGGGSGGEGGGGGGGLKVVPSRHKEEDERSRGAKTNSPHAHSEYRKVTKDQRRYSGPRKRKNSKLFNIDTFNKPQKFMSIGKIFEEEDFEGSERIDEAIEQLSSMLGEL